jgi:hypothetical protein
MSLLSLLIGKLEKEEITKSEEDEAELEEKFAGVSLLLAHNSRGSDKKKCMFI